MKKNSIIFWISTIFIALFEGAMPLSTVLFAPPEAATFGSVHLGYPIYFAYMLITFKVIGSTLLVIPTLPRPLIEWAYAGFGFDFICATISHVIVDGVAFVSFFPLIILAILVVSYIYRDKRSA